MSRKIKLGLGIFISGFFNGFFGVGGGVLIVPLLESLKLKPKVAHATSVAIMAAFSLISFLGYCFNNYFNFFHSIKYVPAGLIGALVGSLVLPKIKGSTLKRIFALILIFSGIRLFFK